MMMDLDAPRGRQATLKHCCRSVATFMCTQVGVGGIIVCYALVGASVFMALETNDDAMTDVVLKNVTRFRDEATGKLWNDYMSNPFNESEWSAAANVTLHEFQVEL